MAARSLMPFSGGRAVSQRPADADPFWAFRRDLNRLFDDFFTDFGLPSLLSAPPGQAVQAVITPRIDVSESDKEIRITTEMPGLDEKNVEVVLSDDVLTIRGQKSAERDEKDHDYHVTERTEGTFVRSLLLPFRADPKQVQARFRNGVLTVTIPKPEEAQETVHRIEVQREDGAAGEAMSRVDRTAAGDKPSGAASSAAAAEGQAETSTG